MDEWILDLIERAGYPGIVLLMALENVVPAIPSELILAFAGLLVAQERLGFAAVVASATAGALAGTSAWYVVGRAVGRDRVHRFVERHGCWLLLDAADVHRAEAWFARHQRTAILIGRLIPGVRSLISVPAGLSGMPPLRFVLYTVLGTAVWNTALTLAGYLLEGAYRTVRETIGPVGTVLLAVALLLVLIRFVRLRARAPSR